MAAGADPFDIVTTRPDYGALDRSGSAVRLRLNSTAVHVANEAGGGVAVDYVKDGSVLRVTAKQAVLACYNAIIPYIAPELPPTQKAALSKMREAADARGQHAAARRPGAAGARHQGRAAPGKLPAEPVPRHRHQRRRLPPDLAARGSLRDAGFRQLRRSAARRWPREPGAYGAREDARHAVRGLRARGPQRAERACSAPAASTPRATSSPSPSTAGRTVTRATTSTSRMRTGTWSRRPRPSAGSASATSRSRTPTPPRTPTRTPRSTRRGGR